MGILRDAVEGYVWMREPASNLGSSGPTRVDVGEVDPEFKPRPVGFAPPAEPELVEPILWEGDGA